jgi:flagella basal body P-ring formation protein FlgA
MALSTVMAQSGQPESHHVPDKASLGAIAAKAASDWGQQTLKHATHPEVMGAWTAKAFEPGTYQLSIEVSPGTSQTRHVRVSFLKAPQASPSAEVRLTLHKLLPVWVLRQAVQPGQAMDCAQVELREEVARVSDARRWQGSCKDLEGQQARRPLTPGDTLLRGDVRVPPTISRQELVTLKTVQGPIQIETPALALHDADVGQTVSVRPQGTHQAVAAMVIAPRTVLLK